MEQILPWITAGATIIGFIGVAIRYGADQEKIHSKNQIQDMVMENIKIDIDRMKIDAEKTSAHNLKQHEEFYQTKDIVIELANDMKYIRQALLKIQESIEKYGGVR